MNRVKFSLRSNLKTDPMIRMVLIHNKKKFVYGTRRKIPHKHWDKKRMRASKSFLKHGSLNKYLNNLENYLIMTIEDFEELDIKPTNAQIKNKLEQLINQTKNTTGKNSVEITPYIVSYIERVKRLKRIHK
jgi:hypothetical protein